MVVRLRVMAPIRIARRVFQIIFVAGSVSLIVKAAMGIGTRTVEYYCPMGGVVSLYGLMKKEQFICALNETNLSVAVALLAGVILTKKTFCSWVCPFGTVSEYLARVRRRIPKVGNVRVPDMADAVLRNFKYAVLAVVLLLTIRASELVFRGYDPFYVLFTGGRGHGMIPILSLSVLGGVLVLTFVFEMAWCRYLCPLSAVMTPLSRMGLLKVKRNDAACTGCGICDRACFQRIPVRELKKITRADCTGCLECVAACPRPGALDVGL